MKAIITDFDGTLCDTFNANFYSYREALAIYNIDLSIDKYKKYFGLRFDDFMKEMNVPHNIWENIREYKKQIYPYNFSHIKLNNELVNYIKENKQKGIKTAIASTARKENLYGVLNYFNIIDIFDVIVCGEDVSKGKPNPEVYLITLQKLNCNPNEVQVFEDSQVGIQAVKNANINKYIIVKL